MEHASFTTGLDTAFAKLASQKQLDGNGRTIMVLQCVLAQRAGFSIDWAATSKNDYLAALTKELEEPHKGIWTLISSR